MRFQVEHTGALFAAVAIGVQHKSVLAVALVGTDRVLADVLAAAVVGRALVQIGKEVRREAGLLHRIVRGELDSHLISERGDRLRNSRTAEGAVVPKLVGGQFAFHFHTVIATVELIGKHTVS